MRALAIPLALLVLLTFAAPASAGHTLQLVHAPQLAAAKGVQMVLPVGVASNCGIVFCSGVTVTLSYTSGGTQRTQTLSMGTLFPAQAGSFVIPGADVRPGLSYRISATQSQCSIATCHSAGASTATFAVLVVG